MQVQSMQMVNGRDAFMLTSWCSASGNSSFPYAWDTNGDLLYHFNNTWELTMANNVVDGATFMALGLPYMWRDVGSVTVPAGSFDDCWNVEQVGSVFYSTYCKDVGPVQHHYDDGGGNGWDAQLTMKN
jgi:hypothetical protein